MIGWDKTIHKTCHQVDKILYVIGGGNKKCRSSGQAVPRGFAARFSALELVTAKLRRLLKKLKVTCIFIDEISMVGSGMFNFLNLRLQQIMGNKEPFGGVSLITVGDLFQLKPVFDKWIFENCQMGYNVLASNIWTEYFTLFELTEIMRQKDEK